MPEIIDRRISFNAGEISPWLDPRLDLDKYRMGCRTLQNMRPSIYGGAFGRSGTRYLGPAAASSSAVRLIPFTREISTNYVLEFSNLKARIWDAATLELVESIADSAWTPTTPYLPQDVVSYDGANYLVLEAHNAGTFATDLAANKLRAYPYQEIVTPYTAAQLDALQSAQQNDVLFLAHPEHAPVLISRQVDGRWGLTDVNIDWPATLGPNISLTTITPLVDIYNTTEPVAWVAGSYASGVQKKGLAGGAYASNYYVSIVSVNTTEPGTAAALGKWVEGRWINAAGIVVSAYNSGIYYLAGTMVSYDGKNYVRNAVFSGIVKNLAPTETTLWAETTNPAVAGFNGMVERGLKIVLKSSAAVWDAGHVGTKWIVGHNRNELKVSFVPSAQAAGYVTESLYVLGEWTLQALATTTATYTADVLVERSLDRVNWEPHYAVQSQANDVNQLLTGTEETPVFLRLKLQAKTGSPPATLVFTLTAGNPTHHGIVQILSFTSSTQVEALVITPLYRYLPTTTWEEPAWCTPYGYPRAVTLHENRLFYGGNKRKPTTVWGSAIDAYQDFRVAPADDRAVSYTLASDESSAIEWLVSQDMLVIGTSSGEWVMGARPGDDAPKLRRNTSFGSAPIQARAIADALVFVQRSRRKVREFAWSFERDGYQANDLIMLSEHLGDAEFKQIAIQRNPESVVWVVTTRGDLLSLTYERGQNVAGWARHVTDGNIESVAVVSGDGEEDHIWVAVKRTVDVNGAFPPPVPTDFRYIERIEPDQPRSIKQGGRNQLIFCDSAKVFTVKNGEPLFMSLDITWQGIAYNLPFNTYDAKGWPKWYLNSGGVVYQVYFSQFYGNPMDPAHWTLSVTSGATVTTKSSGYAGMAANTTWDGVRLPHQVTWPNGITMAAAVEITGLDHLEGKEVAILADGMPHRRMTVVGGAIDLDLSATEVVVGLPYDMILEPTFFETMDPQSVSKQGRKRLMRVAMQFWETLGCQISVDGGETWEPVSFQDFTIPPANALPLFTGQKEIAVNSGTAREVSAILNQTQPLPFNVLSLGSRYTVEMS